MTITELKKLVIGLEGGLYADFKGRRFYVPFKCLCCGKEISTEQFCYGRTCGYCDIGQCQDKYLGYKKGHGRKDIFGMHSKKGIKRMKDTQIIIDKWIKKKSKTKDYWHPKHIFLRLVEEVGELSRAINLEYGEKHRKPEDDTDIASELSDILFTTICLANKLDIDLKKELDKTLMKYSKR